MRDMGTEMTHIVSQEPSRTGTPVRATRPTRSPTSSQPSTPGAAPASFPICPSNDNLDTRTNELSDQEWQLKTRRQIMVLGTKFGKMNVAAWASKDGEDRNASSLLKLIHKTNQIQLSLRHVQLLGRMQRKGCTLPGNFREVSSWAFWLRFIV